MDLIHHTNSPHACDQLACEERQVESDRRAERRGEITTVQDYNLLIGAWDVKIAERYSEIREFEGCISQCRDRIKELAKEREVFMQERQKLLAKERQSAA